LVTRISRIAPGKGNGESHAGTNLANRYGFVPAEAPLLLVMKVIQLTTSSVMLLAVVAALSLGGCRHGQTKPQPPAKGGSPRIEHFVAAGQSDKFCGWPANNGLWTWDRGKEILVGFSFGNYVEQSGHNIQGKSDPAEGVLSRLARSGDGGKTWSNEIIVREDVQPDRFNDQDFGYPQLARNHRDELVAIYYWATKDHPQQQIAATSLAPGKAK